MIGVEASVKTFKPGGYSECSPNYKGSFLLKASSKCTISSDAETLCDELAKDNFRPNYPGLRQGIQNTIVRNTFLEQPATPVKVTWQRKVMVLKEIGEMLKKEAIIPVKDTTET